MSVCRNILIDILEYFRCNLREIILEFDRNSLVFFLGILKEAEPYFELSLHFSKALFLHIV